jgi:hypothetical protein
MANEMVAPILSYEDINDRAVEFLNEHARGDTLPVDIDAIAEFDLGLNIFPFPRLQETFDVEGFISGDLTTIYVDEFVTGEPPNRSHIQPRTRLQIGSIDTPHLGGRGRRSHFSTLSGCLLCACPSAFYRESPRQERPVCILRHSARLHAELPTLTLSRPADPDHSLTGPTTSLRERVILSSPILHRRQRCLDSCMSS